MLLTNISNVVRVSKITYIVCVRVYFIVWVFFYDETKNVKNSAGVGVAGIYSLPI